MGGGARGQPGRPRADPGHPLDGHLLEDRAEPAQTWRQAAVHRRQVTPRHLGGRVVYSPPRLPDPALGRHRLDILTDHSAVNLQHPHRRSRQGRRHLPRAGWQKMLQDCGFTDVVISPAFDTFGGARGHDKARAFEVYGYAFMASRAPEGPGQPQPAVS